LWNTTGFAGGNYTISAYALPVSGEIEVEDNLYVNGVVQVKILDDVPPVTVLNVGEPKFPFEETVYLTSRTPIELTSQDSAGGTGVSQTTYRIYNTTYDSGWIIYAEAFNAAGLDDGHYQIDFNSTDNAGNIEPTNTASVVLDNTPPTTTISLGQPKYVADRIYLTADTTFSLQATDAGSGVKSTTYRIYNATGYDSGWLAYPGTFKLTSIGNGNYTIAFNSTDNLGNVEATNQISVTLFSWNCVFEDSRGRGTILKINTAYKLFQFIRPGMDYGIRKATTMIVFSGTILINHRDSQLCLATATIGTRIDFCSAVAWDVQARKFYYLLDKPGIEK
jgi:hypothetical protein